MPPQPRPPIRVSGTVYNKRTDVPSEDPTGFYDIPANADLGNLSKEDLVRVHFQVGDVALYERSDMFGRKALAYRRTDIGYSGYFKAIIFDGKKWRNLAVYHLLPKNGHHYATQGEKQSVRERLKAAIAERTGQEVTYRKRQYRFADEPSGVTVP